MISIIICSVDPQLLDKLILNIRETIGGEFEIIATDNSIAKFGICKVYNESAGKAKFPILCFMHEDVSIETKNWGELVCNYLAVEHTGLLGVAGGDTKSRVPSPWAVSVYSNEINIVQHDKFGKKSPRHIVLTNPERMGKLKQVVALDGVWLCTKKEVFDQFRFDERTFTGFHGYDIDFSLQVNTRYKVYVVFDILLHHYSEGTPDRNWLESTIMVCRKWKRHLPISVYPLSKSHYIQHHWQSLRLFLLHLFRLEYSFFRILGVYFTYSFTRYFSLQKFLSTGKYILVNVFKRLKGEQV
jgi:hypothetical protein